MTQVKKEMDAQLKISRAVTRAAFSHPFFGSCLLNLRVEESDKVPTMATDGIHVFWNRDFVDELTEDETLGVLCHEIMHVILLHCQPWKGKDPKLCNMAMDYVINTHLIRDGIRLPEGALIDYDEQFEGMAWQEVYAILADIKEKAKQQAENGNPLKDQEGDGTGAADKSVGIRNQQKLNEKMAEYDEDHVKENDQFSEAELEELKDAIERMTVSASEHAKAAGKMPGGVDGIVKEIRTARVDWSARIRTNIKASHPDDYTFRRPNRKLLASSGIYFPSMDSETIDCLVWALDTSASVEHDEMIRYLAEMNAISQELKPNKTLVIYVDADVAKVEEYLAGEEITELNTRGGGGTSFVPVFEYLEYHGIEPDHLIYASDMEVWPSCFPEFAPTYPVTWLSTRADYPVPFGDLILTKGLK